MDITVVIRRCLRTQDDARTAGYYKTICIKVRIYCTSTLFRRQLYKIYRISDSQALAKK
jgi:hypothetical protein